MSVGYGMVISELMNPTGSGHNKPRPIWLYLLLFFVVIRPHPFDYFSIFCAGDDNAVGLAPVAL